MATSPADPFDVVIVGAGPAGMSAACAAAEAGASVALVDGGARVGGQYWRHRAGGAAATTRRSRRAFAALAARVTGRVAFRPQHHVCTVTRDDAGWTLGCLTGAEPRQATASTVLRGRALILAPGAYDRQIPFPGWDLPGVMSAGGVQALLKGHGVPAGCRVVVAGTGPFLLPVAAGLIHAGVEVRAVVEANSPLGFVRHPRALTSAPGKLAEAAHYFAILARARTRFLRGHVIKRARGDHQLTAVEIGRPDRGSEVEVVPCDVLAVGWGFTPQVELPLQVGCATTLGSDGSLVVTVDAAQRTSVDGVWCAGEATGVGGAELAVVEGEIAGRSAAGTAISERLTSRRRRLRTFADALHAVHPIPPHWQSELPDDVLVCRCEEVTGGSVRTAVHDLGATDARAVKLLTRVGMGWCQGRTCGLAAAELTADCCDRPVTHDDLRAFAHRPFATPISLQVLAAEQ